VKILLLKLQTRFDEHFIPYVVKKLLSYVRDGEMTMRRYFRTSKEYFDTSLTYLEVRNKNNENVSKLSCLLLDIVVTREHFDRVIDVLFSECEVLIVNPNELFIEYTSLRSYLTKKEVNGLHLKENMSHDNIGLIYLYCPVTRI
jgi:hypothetical protein